MCNGIRGAAEEAGQKGQRAINVTHVRNAYAFVEKLSGGNEGSKSDRGQVRFFDDSRVTVHAAAVYRETAGNTWSGKSNQVVPF